MYYTLFNKCLYLFCRCRSMDFQSQYANQEMAYDLRQRYAKIVGDHLDDISFYRKERNYPEYFRALEDLYTIVQHKFKNKDKEDKEFSEEDPNKKKRKIKQREKTYSELREELITASNANSEEWCGNSNNPLKIAVIENALRSVEKFLLTKMDEANMFGSKREIEGLV